MPNKLHFYTKYSKQKIKITAKPFASGGEGAIYAIASPRSYSHFVAKIYYPEKRTAEREEKMHYLIQHPPIEFKRGMHPSIGWVEDVIYKDNQFIGIIIQRIKGKKLTKLTLNKLPRRADKAWKRFAFGQPDAIKLRLHTCFNLAVVIRQIHAQERYVIVDLKPDNVLMQSNGLLALVDMDSVEVVEDGKAIFSAPVATPEYTPPEYYQDKERAPIEETWDRFSFGVIFYQLLFGLHPFAAACKPPYDHLVSLNDKIQHRFYVHNNQKKNLFKVIPPPHQRFYECPLELQQLFQACFEAGGINPKMRPTASDWCEVLADLLNLPFPKQPKLNPPPSDLYFSPTQYTKDKNFIYPSLKIAIPNIKNIDTSKKITLNVDSKMVDQLLKDSYQEHIRHDRVSFGTYLLLISIIIITIVQLLPLPLFVGMSFILLAFTYFLFDSPEKVINSIGKKILSNNSFELLGIKPSESIESEKVQFTQKLVHQLIQREKAMLKEQSNAIEKVYYGIDLKDLDFIQRYFKRQKDLNQRVSAFNALVTDAEKAITIAREKELTGYKEYIQQFEEQLQQDTRYQNYTFKSYRKFRGDLEKSIKIQKNNLENIKHNTLHIKQVHEKQLRTLQEATEQQIDMHQKQQETIAQFALKKYTDAIKTSDDLAQGYKQFSGATKKLKKRLKQEKKKVYTNYIKELQSIAKQLEFNSVEELKEQFLFIDSLPKRQQLNGLQNKLQKTFDTLLQEVMNLKLESSHVQSIVDLLQQKIPIINAPGLFTKPKDLKELSDNMEHIHQIIDLEMEQLTLKIQDFDLDTSSENYSVDLAYWIKDCKNLIDNILFNLKNHTKIQKQFYGDPVVFRLYLNYAKKSDQIKAKHQELEEIYQKKMERLEETYKDAIAYNKNKQQIEAKNNELILAKKTALEQQKERAIAVFKKEQAKKLSKQLQQLQLVQAKELGLQEKNIVKKRAKIKQLIADKTTDLSYLDDDYQAFVQQTDKVRTTAEKVYSSHRTLVDTQAKTIEQLIQQTLKEYPKVESLLKEQQSIYNSLIQKETLYKDTLNHIKQLQEEKIRLDSLLEWQENYDSKLYIKDLLLNKIEQFDKKKY